jgi:hypothetical protein
MNHCILRDCSTGRYEPPPPSSEGTLQGLLQINKSLGKFSLMFPAHIFTSIKCRWGNGKKFREKSMPLRGGGDMMRWLRTGTQERLGTWSHSSISKYYSHIRRIENNRVSEGGSRHANISQLTIGYAKTLLKPVYQGNNWSAERRGRSKTRKGEAKHF